MTSKTEGICWAIASNILIGIMLLLIRIASEKYNAHMIVFYRNLFALLMMLIWVKSVGFHNVKTKKLKTYFYRAVVGLIAMQTWFYGLSKLPLPFATALSFAAPIFTAIAAVIFLKEKMHLRRWSAVIIGFIGTIIIINPTYNGINHVVFVIIGSTMLWAVIAIMIKNLTKTESSTAITFYMVLFMTPLSLPFALYFWQDIQMQDIIILASIGLVSNLAQYSMAKSINATELTNIIPVDFSRLIFVSIFAWILFDEYVTSNQIIGSAIIIGSHLYIAYREKKHQAKIPAKKLK